MHASLCPQCGMQWHDAVTQGSTLLQAQEDMPLCRNPKVVTHTNFSPDFVKRRGSHCLHADRMPSGPKRTGRLPCLQEWHRYMRMALAHRIVAKRADIGTVVHLSTTLQRRQLLW
eukprot:scaffold315943_cov37-Tisochrysis_lutea.AAC.1